MLYLLKELNKMLVKKDIILKKKKIILKRSFKLNNIFLDKKVYIYNGKQFFILDVNLNLLNFKIGSFFKTRKRGYKDWGKKKKKGKSLKKK